MTNAKPEISEYKYTTTKPEIGMMDYSGIKIQLIEIPSTFESEYLSVAKSSELIVLIIRKKKEKQELEKMLKENFIRTKKIFVNQFKENTDEIKDKIWKALGLIIVYTKKSQTTMALPTNATVRDFALRIHKDFVKNFRFARLWRNNRIMHIGLSYELKDKDVVEVYAE